MGTLASGSIDLKSLKVAGEPNKYVTYIDATNGIRVHKAGEENSNFAQINSNGLQVYKGGQTDNYKVAEFGETIRIGKESSTYISIDEDSIEGYNSLGTNILDISLSGTALTTTKYISLNYNQTINAHSSYTFTVSEITQYVSSGDHFRITFHFSPLVSGTYTYTYGQSSSSVSGVYYNGGTNFTVNNSSSSTIYAGIPKLEYYVTQIAPSWTFGTRADGDIGAYSCVHGFENVASARYAHAEGCETVASGQYSHAEGYQTTASGRHSHAEGYGTIASGYYSHAEGQNTTANAIYNAHAEGYGTTASGYYSHAEGHSSIASGNYSHAQNRYTIAAKYAQTALGTYNIEDTSSTTSHPSGTVDYGQYALIIGNGTDASTTSNALTVDWGGNVNIASGAKYKINGVALSAADVGAVPTSRTVNSKALSSNITLSAADVSAVALSDKYTRSSAGHLDWSDQTDGDAKVIAKSALAYWNGRFNGTGSNLKYSANGVIIGTANLSSSGTNHTDISISANSVKTSTFTVTRSGYYPICIDRINLGGTGSDKICINKWGVTARSDGSVTYEIAYYNPTSTTYSSITIAVYVLWAKL